MTKMPRNERGMSFLFIQIGEKMMESTIEGSTGRGFWTEFTEFCA
jgi:hypothetical protein